MLYRFYFFLLVRCNNDLMMSGLWFYKSACHDFVFSKCLLIEKIPKSELIKGKRIKVNGIIKKQRQTKLPARTEFLSVQNTTQ